MLAATVKCKWVWYQDAFNARQVRSVHQVHSDPVDCPVCKGCLEIQALVDNRRCPEVAETSVPMDLPEWQGKKDQKVNLELMEPTEREKQDPKVPQESVALQVQQDPKAKVLHLLDLPVPRAHQEAQELPAPMEPTAAKEAQVVQGDPALTPNIVPVRVEGASISRTEEKPEELNMRRAMFCVGLIFIAIHVLMHFVQFDDAVKEKIILNALVLG